MNEMVVSIIIPFYRTERTGFIHCIESVLNQTYDRLEILIVDDGSGAEYSDLLNEVGGKDNRIRIIRCEDNNGLSEARNIGIKHCNGDFVLFLDSDDMLNKFAIENMLLVQHKTRTDIVIGNLKIVNSWECEINDDLELEYKKITKKECYIRMLTKNGFGATACGRLISTKLLENVKFIKGLLHEDMASTWEMFMETEEIVWIMTPLYYYYQGGASSIHSRTISEKFVHDYIFALNRRNSGVGQLYGELNTFIAYSFLLNCPEIYMFASMISDKQIANKYMLEAKRLFVENYSDGKKCNAITLCKKVKIMVFRFSPFIYCMAYKMRRMIMGLRY